MITVMSLPREQMCKGCSLVVQPGYPKCPRCKMPLPSVETPLATATKSSQVKGGTAIESETSSAVLLIVGGIALAGLIAAVLIIASDSSGEKPSDSVAVETAVASENRMQANVRPESPVGISLELEEPGNDEQRRRVLAQLDRDLSDARLWSTVGIVDGEEAVVSVVSSTCEQEDMRPTLLASSESLQKVGFTTVRCLAKHGAQVFELGL